MRGYYPQPYGNIYSAATPILDNTVRTLQAEEYARTQQARAFSSQMDSELARQLGNVKNVDIPDIVDAWNKYKTAKSAIYFNPTLANNPRAYAQAQIEANQALGDYMQRTSASRQHRDMLLNIRNAYEKNHNLFADNALDLYSRGMNTKTSDIMNYDMGGGKTVDLANPNSYLWQGPNTNWADLIKKAAGTPSVKYSEITPPKEGEFTNTITPYSYGASPGEFYQNFLGSLGTHAAANDAAKEMARITPEAINAMASRYMALGPAYWMRATGQPNPQPIPWGNTPQEQFAAYKTMEHAVNTVPSAGKISFEDNKGALAAYKNKLVQDRQEAVQALRAGDQRRLALLKEGFKGKPKLQDQTINDWFQSVKDDAGYDPNESHLYATGEKAAPEIDLTPYMADAEKSGEFSDKPIAPTSAEFIGNGKIQLNYQYLGTDQQQHEGKKIITEQQFKLDVGSRVFGKSKAAGVMKEAHPPITQNGFVYHYNETTGKYE
ncbi:MAG: hypothetical protein C5B59_14000 [Bacteroidetes bacterium]|nr:MAG: hypothetical protein C5B59_14000 [Bacteroidota bacterium]